MRGERKSCPTPRRPWRAPSNSPPPKTLSSSPVRSTSWANCAANGRPAKTAGRFLPRGDEIARRGFSGVPVSASRTFQILAPGSRGTSKHGVGCFRLLPGDRCEKGILAGAQVLAVTEHKLKAAEDANFGLYPGIPQPSGRPEVSGRVINIAAIEEWPGLHGEKGFPENDFVCLRVHEDVVPTERAISLFPVTQ